MNHDCQCCICANPFKGCRRNCNTCSKECRRIKSNRARKAIYDRDPKKHQEYGRRYREVVLPHKPAVLEKMRQSRLNYYRRTKTDPELRAKRLAQQRKYWASPKGQETQRFYRRSERGKAANRAYQNRPDVKAKRKAWYAEYCRRPEVKARRNALKRARKAARVAAAA